MTTQHTPTPWKSYGGGWLGNGAWSQVARVFTSHPPRGFSHAPAAREAEANAAFIVQAVNSHDALVQALELANLRIAELCSTVNVLAKSRKVRAEDYQVSVP